MQSKINGEVKVCEQFGRYSLIADGLIQSGGIVASIWSKPISSLKTEKVKKVLVLGLGGGTVANLIFSNWPEAEITGVELDKEIIFIGKKFFNLGKKKQLKVINADAFVFCKKQEQKFDLIIIDLYKGSKRPSFFVKDKFLKEIRRLLGNNRIAVFNWLKLNEKNLNSFEKNLSEIFKSVEKIGTRTNLFFLARS